MGWIKRAGTIGWAVWVASSSASLARASTEQPSVLVHVDNRAGVPPRDLRRAQGELAIVFQAAGVDIEWSNTSLTGALIESYATPHRRQVVVLLVNAEGGEPRHAAGCPLGFAIPGSGMAYVFYNRTLAVARSHAVDADALLGRVIAHEVGHLLLPGGRHPEYGIMRATLDLAVKNPNRFTDDEVQQIQLRLARSREP